MQARRFVLLATVMASAALVGTGWLGDAVSQPTATRHDSRILDSYEMTLELLLPSPARSRLQEVDLIGDDGVDPEAVAYQAADDAIRLYAPLALEAAELAGDAQRLRTLAPITDANSATIAIEQLRRLAESMAPISPQVRYAPAMDSLISARLAARYAVETTGTMDLARSASKDEGASAPRGHATGTSGLPREASAMAVRTLLYAAGAAHDAMRAGAPASAVTDAAVQSLRGVSTASKAEYPYDPSPYFDEHSLPSSSPGAPGTPECPPPPDLDGED